MMDIPDVYVLEYSHAQEAWHVDTLDNVLRHNMRWFLKGKAGNEYKILAIADTLQELDEFKKALLRAAEQLNAGGNAAR